MRRRAEPSGITLSAFDAALIKGMLLRGDRQHDIVAWFGLNSERVAEIAMGARFAEVDAAMASELPPPGPYPKVREDTRMSRLLINCALLAAAIAAFAKMYTISDLIVAGLIIFVLVRMAGRQTTVSTGPSGPWGDPSLSSHGSGQINSDCASVGGSCDGGGSG